MQKMKTQKGITLIALIITIIMLIILAGVSVTVALNGGLFTKAKDAGNRTEDEIERELELLEGPFEIDGKKYASFEDYVKNKEIVELPEGWTVTKTPEEWTKTDGTINDKVIAIKDENNNTVPLPEGYSVSEKEGEYTISEGLVITDGENEFVWIPVPKGTVFEASYTSGGYSEPKYLKNDSEANASYDSQTTIDYYYGEKDGKSYYTIDINSAGTNGIATNTTVSNGTTFDYGYHYNEMVTSVNKYNGFYVGRYETTIDENNKIGSEEGATILSADRSIPQTNNTPYRWWGLYAAQRNSDVKGNGSVVQTNMIWGRQWEAMLAYFTSEGKTYTETEVANLLTTGKQNAGQSKYTYNSKTISDEICNIYDLRGNVRDCTAQAWRAAYRLARGRILQPYLFGVFQRQRRSDLHRLSWFSSHALYKVELIEWMVQLKELNKLGKCKI